MALAILWRQSDNLFASVYIFTMRSRPSDLTRAWRRRNFWKRRVITIIRSHLLSPGGQFLLWTGGQHSIQRNGRRCERSSDRATSSGDASVLSIGRPHKMRLIAVRRRGSSKRLARRQSRKRGILLRRNIAKLECIGLQRTLAHTTASRRWMLIRCNGCTTWSTATYFIPSTYCYPAKTPAERSLKLPQRNGAWSCPCVSSRDEQLLHRRVQTSAFCARDSREFWEKMLVKGLALLSQEVNM